MKLKRGLSSLHRRRRGAGWFGRAMSIEGLEPRVMLANISWNVAGDGVWDTTTPNWTGSTHLYAEGDNVTFSTVGPGVSPTISIRPEGVNPNTIIFNHYHNTYTLQGGSIGGSTGITMSPYAAKAVFAGYTTGLTFTGGITATDGSQVTWRPAAAGTFGLGTGTIGLNYGTFEYYPSVSGNYLDNTIVFGSAGTSTLRGNANANWDYADVTVGGTLSLGTGGPYFTGLNLRLNGDQQLNLAAHYNLNSRTVFNGVVSGSSYTVTVNATNNASNRYADISGPGNWDVRGMTKKGDGTIRLLASEVVGDCLKIDAGWLNLVNVGDTQTVSELWLGGVKQTSPGTYGSSSSNATYKNDTYFKGPGVVTLLAVPELSLVAPDAFVVEETSDTGTFRITRNDSRGDLRVYYTLGGNASAADYQETLSGSVVIPDGETSVAITVTPVDDSDWEDLYETLTMTLTPHGSYTINGGYSTASMKFTDSDLPADNVMTFSYAMTAGISGFRADWDTPKPNMLGFDAIHRSLMVRFPGMAAEIKRMIEAGHEIESVELILPYAGTELGSDATYAYMYRSSFNIPTKWANTTPQWHAIVYGLRQPWTADSEIGPTYNAYIDAGAGGYGYWAKYGAQDTTHDRYTDTFGGDANSEISSVHPQGRVNVTAGVTGSEYGATLADRLLKMEESGWLVKKWETYDFAFRSNNDPYEWGIETGGRAIWIHTPQLKVTFAENATPPDVSNLDEPVDVHALAQTLTDGAKTATIPTEAQYNILKGQLSLSQPAWMPNWQWTRVQELINLQNQDDPGYFYDFPQTYAAYLGWVDEMLSIPHRMWQGHVTIRMALDMLDYGAGMPAPLQQHIIDYWTNYLMPDRVSSTGAGDWVAGSDMLVHPQGIWGESSSAYYARTHDWRGNSSFYRSGYCYSLSTQNFNHTADTGAMIGGLLIGSDRAIADGRKGFELYPLNTWAWSGGSLQEELDHYYLAITMDAQKMFADYGQSELDQMMGRSALNKTMEVIASSYHPNLRRLIGPSSRTMLSHVFAMQDGLFHALNTVSRNGVQHDVGETLPAGMSLVGHDVPPGLIARLACKSPFMPEWFSNLVDEKPLPYQQISKDGSAWNVTSMGTHWGLGSSNDSTTNSVNVVGQWENAAGSNGNTENVRTLLARYGVNDTNFTADQSNGIVAHQGGEELTVHSGNRMIIFGSPNANLSGYTYTTPADVYSFQTSLGIYNFQTNPGWLIFKNGINITSQIDAGVTAVAGDKFTIYDGVSYIAIIPIASGYYQERPYEVLLRRGATNAISGGGSAAATLQFDVYNFQSATPLNKSAADWTAIDKLYGGFVVEMGDNTSFANFSAFQAHIMSATLSSNWDAANEFVDVNYTSGGSTIKGRFLPAGSGSVPLARLDGQNIYLTGEVKRDNPGGQIAQYTGATGGLTSADKDGGSMSTGWWRYAMIHHDPITRTYAGYQPKTALSTFDLATPDGRHVISDGKVSITQASIDVDDNIVTIDFAYRDEDRPNLADAMLLTGFPSEPTVIRNGAQLGAGLQTVQYQGQTAYVVPLPVADALPRVRIEATDAIAAEQDQDTATFTVSRNTNVGNLTVNYTAGGTAANGADYSALSGSVVIPEGQYSVWFTVTPIDDNVGENNETVVLTLAENAAYWIRSDYASATATIAENDITVQVSATGPDADETGPYAGQFTFTRQGSTVGNLAVNYTVGGTASSDDYSETLTGVVVIPSGASSVTISITPVNDAIAENLESVVLTVAPGAGYLVGPASSAEVIIQDNDRTPLSRTWATVGGGDWDITTANWSGGTTYAEGDNVTFPSLKGTHYIVVESNDVFPGSVTFNHYNGDWYFSGGTIRGRADIRVTNNSNMHFDGFTRDLTFRGGINVDSGDTPTISWKPASADAHYLGYGTINQYGGTFTYQPSVANQLRTPLSFGAGTVSLNSNTNADWSYAPIQVNGGTVQINGSDTWNYNGLVLNLAANSRLSVAAHYNENVQGRFNGVVAGPYTLTVHVTGGGGSTSSWGRVAGPGYWDIAGLTKTGDKPLRVETSEICGDVLTIAGGAGKLNLVNASDTQTVTELWLGGTQMTQYGTYGSVSSAADYVHNAYFDGQGMVRLVPSKIQISATDATSSESPSDSGTFTITRVGSTSGSLTVHYSIGGSATAGDYTPALTGSVVIPDGQASATITITPINDGLIEGPEALTLTLLDDAAYGLGANRSATVTIVPPGPDALAAAAVSASQINLSWTYSGATPTGYEIDRATDSGFTQNLITATVDASATGYIYTNLAASGPYYFRVRATSDAGGSAYGPAAAAVVWSFASPTDSRRIAQSGGQLQFFDNNISPSTPAFSVPVSMLGGIHVIANGGVLAIDTALPAGSGLDVNTDDVGVASAVVGTSQQLSSLQIGTGGSLDLDSHSLTVAYGGASPAATIAGCLASGYAGGAWNGTGIHSSTAASQPAMALGWKDTGAQVIVDLTLYGDADLDGIVNFADLLVLSQNYNTTGRNWATGDSTYDGTVNFNDLLKLSQNYNQTAPAPEAPAQATAPRQTAAGGEMSLAWIETPPFAGVKVDRLAEGLLESPDSLGF